MFWVRIRLGGREYLGVLDTGATISIVAKNILPCGRLKNTMTTRLYEWGMDMWCTAAGTVRWRYLWAPGLSLIGSM